MPDMASKNDARHGIKLSQLWLFDAMSGVKKIATFTPAISQENHHP